MTKNAGGKEAKNALRRGQSMRLQPWLRETLRSTLSMGMGPQGGGFFFLYASGRWMHLSTCTKMTTNGLATGFYFSRVYKAESYREFEMKLGLRLFEL